QWLITIRRVTIGMKKVHWCAVAAKVNERNHKSIFPIIDLITISRFDLQVLMNLVSEFLPVFFTIVDAINPFIQIIFYSIRRIADLVPFQIKLIVAIIIYLRIG